MSPQEKAEQLLNLMEHTDAAPWVARHCALVAVDEIISYVDQWDRENEMEFNEDGGHVDYRQQVKAEIEKI